MITFGALMDVYLERQLKGKSSYDCYCRLNRQLLQGWASSPAAEITRAQIRHLHERLRPTPAHANRLLGMVRAAFRWAQHNEDGNGIAIWSGDNPAIGIRRHRTVSRNRVLTNREIGLLIASFEVLFPKLRAFLTILLCTGCRMSEARLMRWSDVDLERGSWVKPTTKNGTPQLMPLAAQAREALSRMPQQGVYVFNGLYGHEWSRAAVEKIWQHYRAALGLQYVTLHDFRRTVATRLYDAERDELLIKACLNHSDSRPIAVYVRFNFDRLAEALQAHADRLWALKEGVPVPTLYVENRLKDQGPGEPITSVVKMEWPG